MSVLTTIAALRQRPDGQWLTDLIDKVEQQVGTESANTVENVYRIAKNPWVLNCQKARFIACVEYAMERPEAFNSSLIRKMQE